MGIFVPFLVYCSACGRANQPAKKVSEAIKNVLSGKLLSCRHCGSYFSEIIVPARPMVMQICADISKLSKIVKIVGYDGVAPETRGIV